MTPPPAPPPPAVDDVDGVDVAVVLVPVGVAVEPAVGRELPSGGSAG